MTLPARRTPARAGAVLAGAGAALAAVLAVAFAAGHHPPVDAAAAAFPLRVRDALGRSVVVPAPPQRIVSVAPSVTEILFALGLGERLAGVSDADDFPPAGVRGKPRVGGVVLDAERILRLDPDLVVGVASLQREQLGRLIRLRLPVLAVDARELEEVFAQIGLLGRVTARVGDATRLRADLRARAELVGRRIAGRRTPRVYVEIWDQPPMTAGEGTFLHDLLQRAGGGNVFGDLRAWRQVSPEAVVRRDPEVILLTYPGRAKVLRRPGWGRVTAVRRQRVHELDPDLVTRPGPRLVRGLEAMARLVHPEVFAR